MALSKRRRKKRKQEMQLFEVVNSPRVGETLHGSTLK